MDGFLLSRPDRTLRTHGARERFDTTASAVDALTRGTAGLIVGALPFDPRCPAALTAPESATVSEGPWQPGVAPALPSVLLEREMPSPAEHVARVTKLVEQLQAGRLGKVVSARSVVLRAEAPISPVSLAARLVNLNPAANGFAVDLTSAGDGFRGHTLVGASPEVLLSLRGPKVTCRPLAGTAPRRSDADADQREAQELLQSAKNLAEHAFVTAWIEEILAPLCVELTVPEAPVLMSTPEVWHLATPITGVLRDPAMTSLTLASLLHPTPALCGTPTDLALDTIRATEEERRFYGGTVGWCDAAGDGDWIVAIRCAELTADGREALATAGGGIVAESDPLAELAETSTKLRTLLSALGVQYG